MHWSLAEEEFIQKRNTFIGRWNLAAPAYSSYFIQQWLSGTCSRWQVYCNPTGYALTNNPVETFNWYLKRRCNNNIRAQLPMFIPGLATIITDNPMGKPYRYDHVVNCKLMCRSLSD